MLPKKGKVFPNRDGRSHFEIDYGKAIAAALRADLRSTHRATKIVMRWTGASERTVKNWLAARSGSSGEHLVALIHHSDAVFETFMHVAGRDQAVAAKKLIDARDALVKMLELIVDLTDGDPIAGTIEAQRKECLRRVRSPPPVSPFGILFSRPPTAAGTPQNAGVPAHLSEPRTLARKPILGCFPSLCCPFL